MSEVLGIDHSSVPKKKQETCIYNWTHVYTVVPPPEWIARYSRILAWRWRHGLPRRELHHDSAQSRYRRYR